MRGTSGEILRRHMDLPSLIAEIQRSKCMLDEGQYPVGKKACAEYKVLEQRQQAALELFKRWLS